MTDFEFSYFRCLSKLEYLGAGENNLTSLPAEIGRSSMLGA